MLHRPLDDFVQPPGGIMPHSVEELDDLDDLDEDILSTFLRRSPSRTFTEGGKPKMGMRFTACDTCVARKVKCLHNEVSKVELEVRRAGTILPDHTLIACTETRGC
jgi:hypothetical protein